MDATDFRLLNDFQRDFPLTARPFAALAERLSCTEDEVIFAFGRLRQEGVVSRIGAVLAPRRVGASTLAALQAPAAALERIAAIVSDRPEVNHNYQREHRLNLWFVATARDEAALTAALGGIAQDTGCTVLRMPLVREFHIDLGFALDGRQASRALPAGTGAVTLDAAEQRLLRALQDGLELLPRPYSRLAMRAGLDEGQVLDMLDDWLIRGLIKRFGVVVRHHELGYTANAMAVWDVPDATVAAVGRELATEPAVTLCYQRARALPDWPFNLFCMIHGRDRDAVAAQIAQLSARHRLAAYPSTVLFSVRRFKQCGARYVPERLEAGHA
ncbi:MAG: Lrp/AsnC family transcriptional regulator [Rhodocyclaceae bacterium]|nr:Lrp/AsnC family transcriptional regulator [Rhodocyclaceae bacterium]